MAKTLQEILGGQNMTGIIQSTQSGLPNLLGARIPKLFAKTDSVIGDKGSYIKTNGARESAAISQYGSPARRVQQRSFAETGVTLLHTFEEQAHNPFLLQALVGMNGEPIQEMAIQQIDSQTAEFKKRFENLRINTVHSLIAKGKMWFDSLGRVQFTSASAAVEVDPGIPAGNHGTVSGIFNASWGTAATDIPTQINALKKKALQSTGRELKYAVYGANIDGYVFSNTSAKNMLNGNMALANMAWTSGRIPNGFCGLEWIPADAAFGLNSAGSITDWFDGDQISFFPEVDSSWYRFYEGSYPIPTSIDIKSDVVAAAKSLQIVYGQFAYATVGHNPPGVTQFAGDTFMPVIASANDLYIADVVP